MNSILYFLMKLWKDKRGMTQFQFLISLIIIITTILSISVFIIIFFDVELKNLMSNVVFGTIYLFHEVFK